ncbi:hypothetical protein M2351_003837 [Azospirillum canadense]|nr:hypothetical protein [Azospirillum canadense]MCW2239207.1 hypothetical protein [Azospirillum canadense]
MIELVGERTALVIKLAAPIGQFLQADHLRLIGIQQALIGTGQAIEPRRDPLLRLTLVSRMPIRFAGKLVKLSDQPLGGAQEIANVLPHHSVQIRAFDVGARTGTWARGFHAVFAGTAIIVTRDVPRRRPGDAVHGKTACATREQAAQQVVVFFVVAEGQGGIPRELLLTAIPSLLVNDGRDGNRNPLFLWP